MEVLTVLKGIFLYIGIWWTMVNITRMHARNNISNGNILLQSAGITGFIYLQWLV